MTIRLALIAAACLSAAGCTSTVPSMSGAFSSLRPDEPPARTCRNVASDAVAISARASASAGITVREPRIGESGLTEVAWPLPSPDTDPTLAERMARLQAESDLSGCAIAFRDSLPPTASEVAALPAAAPEPVVKPNVSRSAWNGPATGAATRATVGSSPAAPQSPAYRSISGNPDTPPLSATRPVERTASRPASDGDVEPAPPRPAPKPVFVPAPRSAVRSIPITPAPPPSPTP